MNQQELELAPLLARRELWLLVSVAYVDPYHRQRLELLCDPAFRQRTLEAGALMRQEHPTIELGPGELDPKTVSFQEFFSAFDAGYESFEKAYRQLFGLTPELSAREPQAACFGCSSQRSVS